MTEVDTRKYFWRIYELLRRATESFILWAYIRNCYDGTLIARSSRAIYANHDLLNLIASNARSNAIIVLYILCDDSLHGSKGCNIFKLLEKGVLLAANGIEKHRAMFKKLKPEIGKLRLLRNNLDAHLCERDDWKVPFNKGPIDQANGVAFDRVLRECFAGALCVAQALDIDAVGHKDVEKRALTYCDRLLRALTVQCDSKAIGDEPWPLDEENRLLTQSQD